MNDMTEEVIQMVRSLLDGTGMIDSAASALTEQMQEDKTMIDDAAIEVMRLLASKGDLRSASAIGVGLTVMVNAYSQLIEDNGKPSKLGMQHHAMLGGAIMRITEQCMRDQFERIHPEAKEILDDTTDGSADDHDEQGDGTGNDLPAD